MHICMLSRHMCVSMHVGVYVGPRLIRIIPSFSSILFIKTEGLTSSASLASPLAQEIPFPPSKARMKGGPPHPLSTLGGFWGSRCWFSWQVLSSLSNFRSSSLFVFIPSSWYLGHSVFVEMSCYILEMFILELCYQTCGMKYWLILTGALWFWGPFIRNRSKERSNWQLWWFWEFL